MNIFYEFNGHQKSKKVQQLDRIFIFFAIMRILLLRVFYNTKYQSNRLYKNLNEKKSFVY